MLRARTENQLLSCLGRARGDQLESHLRVLLLIIAAGVIQQLQGVCVWGGDRFTTAGMGLRASKFGFLPGAHSTCTLSERLPLACTNTHDRREEGGLVGIPRTHKNDVYRMCPPRNPATILTTPPAPPCSPPLRPHTVEGLGGDVELQPALSIPSMENS